MYGVRRREVFVIINECFEIWMKFDNFVFVGGEVKLGFLMESIVYYWSSFKSDFNIFVLYIIGIYYIVFIVGIC